MKTGSTEEVLSFLEAHLRPELKLIGFLLLRPHNMLKSVVLTRSSFHYSRFHKRPVFNNTKTFNFINVQNMPIATKGKQYQLEKSNFLFCYRII